MFRFANDTHRQHFCRPMKRRQPTEQPQRYSCLLLCYKGIEMCMLASWHAALIGQDWMVAWSPVWHNLRLLFVCVRVKKTIWREEFAVGLEKFEEVIPGWRCIRQKCVWILSFLVIHAASQLRIFRLSSQFEDMNWAIFVSSLFSKKKIPRLLLSTITTLGLSHIATKLWCSWPRRESIRRYFNFLSYGIEGGCPTNLSRQSRNARNQICNIIAFAIITVLILFTLFENIPTRRIYSIRFIVCLFLWTGWSASE